MVVAYIPLPPASHLENLWLHSYDKCSYPTQLLLKTKLFFLYMRFQVLTVASMKFRFVFWDVLPCKIIVNRLLEVCAASIIRAIPLKHRSTIILHGSASQKINLNFFCYISDDRRKVLSIVNNILLCKFLHH
jgi:hypothetical protein